MGKSLSERLEDVLKLTDEAAAWADEHKSAVKVPQDVEPDDKWLARSALQKAIRRGEHDEALSQAARLWKCDPDYCWFALGVIAVEDVGFGSPECVLWSHVCQLKTFRSKIDDGRMLTALVSQMCEAVKTRSCCEMSIAVDWGTAGKDQMELMTTWSSQALLATLLGDDLTMMYAALRVLRGWSYPEGTQKARSVEDRAEAEELIMEMLPEPYGLAAVHAWRRPVDSMSQAVFPTTKLFLDILSRAEIEIVEDVMPPSQRIGKFNSEAWDMHSAQGKKALKAFYTSLSKSYSTIAEIPKEKAVKALGAAVFVEEGGLVDRRVLGAGLYDLMEAQDETFLPQYGVPMSHYDEIRKIVREEIERLNSKRKWVFKLGESW
jgi:hypothetical protein